MKKMFFIFVIIRLVVTLIIFVPEFIKTTCRTVFEKVAEIVNVEKPVIVLNSTPKKFEPYADCLIRPSATKQNLPVGLGWIKMLFNWSRIERHGNTLYETWRRQQKRKQVRKRYMYSLVRVVESGS